MNNTLIFKDEFSIKYLRDNLTSICMIMNDNHKKVLSFNKNLSYVITFYNSFYNVNSDNTYIIEKTYNELTNLIKSQSPFYTKSMVDEYYKKLNKQLHYNDYRESNGFYLKTANNFDEEERLRKLAENNLKSIPRGTLGLAVLESYDMMVLAEKYIDFDGEKFIINEDRFKEYEDKMTYHTSNKNQSKVMKILCNINDEFEELSKIDNNISPNLFNCNGKLIEDRSLLKLIKNIK